MVIKMVSVFRVFIADMELPAYEPPPPWIPPHKVLSQLNFIHVLYLFKCLPRDIVITEKSQLYTIPGIKPYPGIIAR